ncbi:gene transfer agent family protein [Roseovarius sp. PS-C2]|uniref:gene transfer agent family protein n=1 Tax=Roseovarius sp. PS-C2 TaxID=2820814 RepID=UPI001C0D38A4|nr:gene transfer agent family protein [Roseovarius sp. PS-C2]MBU3262061.1 gene transfer agent family protein [Roseovarius sp. PS-C2]
MDTVRLSWVGGEHPFALPLGRLRALQENCNAGPEEVFNRLRLGRWHVDDVLEPIRLGLIGGGMPDGDAGPLVTRIADQGDLIGLKLTAIAVLASALFAPEDDPVGEGEGVTTSAPENGGSPTSTETAQ